jgi:hypothetical protein
MAEGLLHLRSELLAVERNPEVPIKKKALRENNYALSVKRA